MGIFGYALCVMGAAICISVVATSALGVFRFARRSRRLVFGISLTEPFTHPLTSEVKRPFKNPVASSADSVWLIAQQVP